MQQRHEKLQNSKTPKLQNRLFYLVCLAFLIFTVSCEKDAIVNEEFVPSNSNQNRHALFYSNDATYKLLSPNVNTAWKTNGVYSEEDTDSLKAYLQSFNITLSDRYIDRIIERYGYPFWDATKVVSVTEGGQLTMTPIFKENSEKINAIFVHTMTNEKSAYSFVSRAELEELKIEVIDPNVGLYDQAFKDFDQELFNIGSGGTGGGGAGGSWDSDCRFYAIDISDAFIDEFDADGNLITTTDFTSSIFTCNEGCLNDIEASGIVLGEFELTWLNGGCVYPNMINEFLYQTSFDDDYDENELDAAQFLFEVFMTEELNLLESRALIEHFIEHFTFNYESTFTTEEEIAEQAEDLLTFFADNGYNMLAVGDNVYDFIGDPEVTLPLPTCDSFGTKMYSGDYYGTSASTQAELNQLCIDELPGEYGDWAPYIEKMWACRVLGGAHEKTTLTSMGLPLDNNDPVSDDINGKKPDGFFEIPSQVETGPVLKPFLVEMKFKGTVGNFTYSHQTSQFNGYRNYLKNNAGSSENTILHGLYMVVVMPITSGGATDYQLADVVIEKCNEDNIPLYHSGVDFEQDGEYVEIKVQCPELKNAASLNRDGHQLKFLHHSIFKRRLEANIMAHLGPYSSTDEIVPNYYDYAISDGGGPTGTGTSLYNTIEEKVFAFGEFAPVYGPDEPTCNEEQEQEDDSDGDD